LAPHLLGYKLMLKYSGSIYFSYGLAILMNRDYGRTCQLIQGIGVNKEGKGLFRRPATSKKSKKRWARLESKRIRVHNFENHRVK